jgi:hypothetical protein
VAPPVAYKEIPRRLRRTSAALVAAVVVTVRLADPAEEPVILTGLVEPKLKVGGSLAPVGLAVSAAVSATLPKKPPLGVTVIVDVLPVVAPGLTMILPLLVRANAATTGADTVTFTVVVCTSVPEVPVTWTV